MNLKKKSTILMSVATVVMVATLLISCTALFRYLTVISIEPSALIIAKLIRDDMLSAMKDGRTHEWSNVRQRLTSDNGIMDLQLYRAPAVSRQFGPGEFPDYKATEQELDAIKQRKPIYSMHGSGKSSHFNTTIPFFAQSDTETNCLECHEVPLGTVLGAVTIEISLGEQSHTAMLSVVAIVGILMVIAIVTIISFRRALSPFEVTAKEIASVVNKSHTGDFSGRVTQNSNDEIGNIAKMLNQLLTLVECEVTGLSKKVANLLHYETPLGRNLLLSMTELVETLVDVSKFKQAIEEDESRAEVYCRLTRIISEQFNINQFSLYEIDIEKNRMLPVCIDGKPSDVCQYCVPEITLRATACRAKRTGHIVDSSNFPKVCSSFAAHNENSDTVHICIPVIQSGSVGNVLQMVIEREHAYLTEMYVPFIAQYLREAAPVIESKRLMDTLRQSSLTDPMTGLHNRRFMEEFTQNLVAHAERNKTVFSVLMADLDYFKKVNDTYGHEAGDLVLKELAKVLQNTVRSSDLVIRYGGEEFVIILRDADAESADAVAEKLRAAVEELKVQLPGKTLSKTLSIGVATFLVDSDSFWQVVKYADVAMYKAKENGRNRILHFSPEMWDDNANY